MKAYRSLPASRSPSWSSWGSRAPRPQASRSLSKAAWKGCEPRAVTSRRGRLRGRHG